MYFEALNTNPVSGKLHHPPDLGQKSMKITEKSQKSER